MGKTNKDTGDDWAEHQRQRIWGPLYHQLPFPVKLHMLVSSHEFSDLWWIESGEAFAVDREGYKKNIMSVFFDQNKFRSLQTLLWKYEFCTVASINNSIEDVIFYHHRFFVRDRPDLCKLITRKDHVTQVSPLLPQRNIQGTRSSAIQRSDVEDDEWLCHHLRARRDSLHFLVEKMRVASLPATSTHLSNTNSRAHDKPGASDDEMEPKTKLSRLDIVEDVQVKETLGDLVPNQTSEIRKKPDEPHKTTRDDSLFPTNETGGGGTMTQIFEALFDDLFV